MTRLRPLTLVIALAGLLAVLLPAAPSEAGGREPVRFTLGGTVLDGGEQVTSLTLDARRLGAIRASSLSTATFTVRAVGRIPAGVDPGTQPMVAYDAARTVSAATLTDAGRTALDAALPDHLETERGLLAGLDRGEQEQLAGLLRRFLVSLGRTPDGPPRDAS